MMRSYLSRRSRETETACMGDFSSSALKISGRLNGAPQRGAQGGKRGGDDGLAEHLVCSFLGKPRDQARVNALDAGVLGGREEARRVRPRGVCQAHVARAALLVAAPQGRHRGRLGGEQFAPSRESSAERLVLGRLAFERGGGAPGSRRRAPIEHLAQGGVLTGWYERG